LLPARHIKEVVIVSVLSQCCGIILSNDGQGLRGDLTGLLLDHDVVRGSIVGWISGAQQSFMRSDLAELPDDRLFIILTSSDILEDLIIGQQLLILVIVDGDTELVNILIGSKIMVMLLSGFHNACSKALAVLLFIHEEGATNQIGGVEDWSRV